MKEKFKINKEINFEKVRVIDLPEGSKILTKTEALKIAESLEKDLILINEKTDIPICKIEDYSKFLYQRKKKIKENEKNTTKVLLKEVKFGPNIDEHDFNFKVKQVEKFISEGMKVKLSIKFSGREIVFKERGELVLLKVIQSMGDTIKVDYMPRLEGKNMHTIITPNKKIK